MDANSTSANERLWEIDAEIETQENEIVIEIRENFRGALHHHPLHPIRTYCHVCGKCLITLH